MAGELTEKDAGGGVAGTPEDNKQLVLRALEIITGNAPEELAARLFAADYTDHNTTGRSGPEWVISVARRLRGAFPDLAHEVHRVVAEGDLVTLYTTMRGTQKGHFLPYGLEPTGRRIEITTMHVFRVLDGRIAEHWAVRDDLTMLRQLGIDFPPEAVKRAEKTPKPSIDGNHETQEIT